ncbi:MAG: DUF2132 domain-containing protein [Verrucomicrobiales bacterium]|nr:DUF2132 domain-containing protein [Verrucomicrobiales bacterium]
MLNHDPQPNGDPPPARPAPSHPKDPLHGVTLETMLRRLVDYLGWEEMGYRVPIRCFTHDPSITSSLKFLRKTPWARKKVEELYLRYDYPEE